MNQLHKRQRSITRALLLAFVIVPILFVVPWTVLPVHAAGTLYINPPQQGPFPVNTMVTYQVKVAGMDSFTGWDVSVQTDPRFEGVLIPVSLSLTGNLFEINFSASVIQVVNCVGGSGSSCRITDGPNSVHSQVISSGPSASGSGLLFTITYQVLKADPAYTFLTTPAGFDYIIRGETAVPHSDSPGTYGVPLPYPVANFVFSPTTPVAGENVTFDASSSSDPNPGATIGNYTWYIVDILKLGSTGGKTNSTSQPILVHKFSAVEVPAGTNNATFFVGLIVKDSLGRVSPQATQLIIVSEISEHRLALSYLQASPQDNILPGTPINITLGVLNRGTFTELGFNLTIYLNGRVYKTFNSTAPIVRQHVVSRSFILPTTGLQPDSYDLVAAVSNDPSGNGHLTVRIISLYQGSLIPFTMPQFAAVIIAIIAALGVVRLAVGRSRLKRRLRAQELS